ncbi:MULTISPECIES: hypothetical protein [unclassified Methanoregula]|uniref:hypothetical protein n=1 Tax=unclassified Methanoregula TaxID=2649730 RepID=UPI0009CAC794|nr:MULTISPECIES: hypothetical protein [unclassified Methanoregula]OPX65203.1 MAG: hypothetical protein A4E33_00235 [Methanoregula sp. PtaB.Bin085]OPY32112.1 MAG: hypothetical protein A4E34_02485 [Methanoregula sp. PtaU1.Bin006]
MGKRKRAGPSLSPAAEVYGRINEADDDSRGGASNSGIFTSLMEFSIVLFCVAYSLFCVNAYLLNAVSLRLSVFSLSILLIAELALLGRAARSKIIIQRGYRTTAWAILVFLLSLGISLNKSPSLLPISWSADYPNHYILIDFLSTHEQLPLLTSGLGEMVQYPFGPSLFTAVSAKMTGLSLMTMTGVLAAFIAAILAVMVYLLARKFLDWYETRSAMADAAAMVSAFMVFSVPSYYIGQYCGDFYYSMMFGELLVLLTLLALMHVEAGERLWLYVFIIATAGIIFTYTLFIVIPVCALIFFTILNPEKIRQVFDRFNLAAALFTAVFFVLFTFERMSIGTHILQYEGVALEPDLLRFNLIFIGLIVCGTILSLKCIRGFTKNAISVYCGIVIAECLGFFLLSQYGIIAAYYAKKTLYLLVLLLPVVASLPVLYAVRRGVGEKHRSIALYGIIGLIGIFSLYTALTFPVQEKPVVTPEDAIFAQKAETYLRNNNIPYQNLSITTGELKGYWFGLLLHMDKNYVSQRFLANATPFSEWLLDPDARYVAGEMVNATYPEFFEMKGIRLQIVVRQGQKVLIRKVD